MRRAPAVAVTLAALFAAAPAHASAAVRFSAAPLRVVEPAKGSVRGTFVVRLARPSSGRLALRYRIRDGSARRGRDFTARHSGTIRFLPGQTKRRIAIRVLADGLDEDNERLKLVLPGGAFATATILDRDARPTMRVDDVRVPESVVGGQALAAHLKVRLSHRSGRRVTVSYATSEGSAVAGSTGDFFAKQGSLAFAPGETVKTVSVFILADAVYEREEQFTLTLSKPVHARLERATAGVTIYDQGKPPPIVFSAQPTTATESAGQVSVRIAPDRPVTARTTVGWSTLAATATSADFVAARGTLTFQAGESAAQVVAVPLRDDALDEDDETFVLRTSASTQPTAIDVAITILDDDPSPAVSIQDGGGIVEGNSGLWAAPLAVSLSAISGRSVTVHYATADGSATAGEDYDAGSGTLTFAPGETTKSVLVNARGDTSPEFDESVFVVLTNPINAVLGFDVGATVIGTDDGYPCPQGDDSFEDNDSLAQAKALTPGVLPPTLALCPGDADFFQVPVPAGGKLTATVSPDVPTDPDLTFYDAGGQVMSYSDAYYEGGPESLTWTNTTGSTASIRMRVADAGNVGYYDLDVVVG